ncbi:hypothetical protein A2U01_0104435, partial [Trifolium medium]|nr:hypothetical protein [Trifolium medium]
RAPGETKSGSFRVPGEIWGNQQTTSRLARMNVSWRPHAQVGAQPSNFGPNHVQTNPHTLVDP